MPAFRPRELRRWSAGGAAAVLRILAGGTRGIGGSA